MIYLDTIIINIAQQRILQETVQALNLRTHISIVCHCQFNPTSLHSA